MAAAVAFSGFATVTLQMLIEAVLPALLKKLRLMKCDSKQDKLAKLLGKLNFIIDDVAGVVSEETLKSWTFSLTSISYCVDDMIDELNSENRKANFKWRTSSSFTTKLNAIEAELKELISEIIFFRSNGQDKRVKFSAETTSLVFESMVSGRIKEMTEICRVLTEDNLSSDGQSFEVVSITGEVGIGKTTLAKQIFHCEDLDQSFHRKIWISIPQEFNLNQISRLILESYTRQSVDLIQLDTLQVQLGRQLAGVKFFLVLDGLAHRDHNDLTTLLKSLSMGHPGSKILLTTQDEKVATLMGSIHSWKLGGLSGDYIWQIFNQGLVNYLKSVPPHVIGMESEVKQICEGVPLAAVSLGKFLSTHSELDKKIVQAKGLELLEGDRNILSSISRMCYHLPLHLRKCLSFCSFFNVGQIFKGEILVAMWMALGYIPTEGGLEEEDMASHYLENFLELSVFQQHEPKVQSKFTLPRIVHLAAKHICIEECWSSVTKTERLYKNIQHAVIAGGQVNSKEVYECKKLRTLILSDIPRGRLKLSDLAEKFKLLRVLSLIAAEIDSLPESIKHLKHLRYLDLFGATIRSLCDDICSLENLQTLRLRRCFRLLSLPKEMRKLTNLRHLVLDVRSQLRSLPEGVLDLPKLHTLGAFFVDLSTSLITQLAEKNALKGSFGISNLEALSANPLAAVGANMIEKKDIHSLHLRWTRQVSTEACLTVLENLRPHKNLRELRLFGYCALDFPTWVSDESYALLQKIVLSDSVLDSHPHFPELRYLKVLTLRSLGITTLPNDFTLGFPSLEMLIIEEMQYMAVWDGLQAEIYPNLHMIHVSACPVLAALPRLHLLPKLRSLHIRNCNALVHIPEDGLPVLDYLLIEGCATLLTNCTSEGEDMEKISRIATVVLR